MEAPSCTGSLLRPEAILELTALINSSLDPRIIRERAIEAAAQLMDADAGSLLLIDGESGELFFEVATGVKGERLKVIRLPQGEGIAGWVVRTGQGVIIDEAGSDPRFFRKADQLSQYETRSIIAVPVQIKGRILGVLQAVNKRQGSFSADDLHLFQALANQVAIAIENASLYRELRATFSEMTLAFAEALDKRDAYTGSHTRRVRHISLAVGKHLGLGAGDLEDLALAAVLHDIGKIGVPDDILQKNGRLDAVEYAAMCQHSRYGVEILHFIQALQGVLPAIRGHHEQYDGSGYPDQLAGSRIPLSARIIGVADAFDAMTSDRPYRKALSQEAALAELLGKRGSQFDPEAVDALVSVCRRAGFDLPAEGMDSDLVGFQGL